MVFNLQLSHTAQKALDKLPPNVVKKIFIHLGELRRDPYRARPMADIVPVAGSDEKYRLRVGKLRVEYEVDEDKNIIKLLKNLPEEKKIRLQIKRYTNNGDDDLMASRSEIIVAQDEPLNDWDLAALEEEEESTAEELQALLEREKDDFISLEEYAKLRGISL
jgi:mRNA-degrading endonuclease RelE of RelBE toxin-antitoxin system